MNTTRAPQEGDYIKPDGWKAGEIITADDGYKDSSFPGCQFRIPAGGYRKEINSQGIEHYTKPFYMLAINVTVTGRKPDRNGHYRVKIEFVGDGEPSTFTGGIISFKN